MDSHGIIGRLPWVLNDVLGRGLLGQLDSQRMKLSVSELFGTTGYWLGGRKQDVIDNISTDLYMNLTMIDRNNTASPYTLPSQKYNEATRLSSWSSDAPWVHSCAKALQFRYMYFHESGLRVMSKRVLLIEIESSKLALYVVCRYAAQRRVQQTSDRNWFASTCHRCRLPLCSR